MGKRVHGYMGKKAQYPDSNAGWAEGVVSVLTGSKNVHVPVNLDRVLCAYQWTLVCSSLIVGRGFCSLYLFYMSPLRKWCWRQLLAGAAYVTWHLYSVTSWMFLGCCVKCSVLNLKLELGKTAGTCPSLSSPQVRQEQPWCDQIEEEEATFFMPLSKN